MSNILLIYSVTTISVYNILQLVHVSIIKDRASLGC